MIPKIIHYCWFGRKDKPKEVEENIANWRKMNPDFVIKEWNEDNFDVNIIKYTKQAYEAKKYAFVSDYARFWILYHYGGVYFDTDVEVIKPMDEIIQRGPFMGCECSGSDTTTIDVAPGLGLGVYSGCNLYKELLELYSKQSFFKKNGTLNTKTIVQYTTELLIFLGLKNINDVQKCEGIWIYPKEYFCPLDYYSGIMEITEKTYCIHHYCASWLSEEKKYANKITQKLNVFPYSLRYRVGNFVAAVKYRGLFNGIKELLGFIYKKIS